MTTTIVNQRGGTCADCDTYVPARAGTCTKAPGGWTVHCADHGPKPGATAAGPGRQRSTEDQEQEPAQIRYTGTPAQVTALVEALKTAPHIKVRQVSQQYERREEPGSVSVHVRAEVDPRLLAVIEREEAER
ncbi:hypothetical protein [Streptomyces sp. HUAS TT7]|uniref:hypothetical protein n=1 Tax=Streptomyces sp. HUAS TT7 TaxID=3447507 RepID=UPI003F65684F